MTYRSLCWKHIYFCYFCICVYVCVWVLELMCLWVTEVFEPLELKFQAFMKHCMWVLGLKLCSSGRPVHAFNLCRISPVPNLCQFCCSMSFFSKTAKVKNKTWDIVSWMLIFLLVYSCFYKSERSVSESVMHSLQVQIINTKTYRNDSGNYFHYPPNFEISSFLFTLSFQMFSYIPKAC